MSRGIPIELVERLRSSMGCVPREGTFAGVSAAGNCDGVASETLPSAASRIYGTRRGDGRFAVSPQRIRNARRSDCRRSQPTAAMHAHRRASPTSDAKAPVVAERKTCSDHLTLEWTRRNSDGCSRSTVHEPRRARWPWTATAGCTCRVERCSLGPLNGAQRGGGGRGMATDRPC